MTHNQQTHVEVDGPAPKWPEAVEHQCTKCAYIYEPASGDATSGVPVGTPWEALPSEWGCPHCGASRSVFQVWRSARPEGAVYEVEEK